MFHNSLGIRASSGALFYPGLTIRSQFINNQAIKFLCKVIQVPLDAKNIKNQVLQQLTRELDRVEASRVTRQQKLRLYRVGICPRIAWDPAINNFLISWVKRQLEATDTHSLKKWSGLAKSADTARLYLPQSQGGLGLPSLSCCSRSSKFHKPVSC